MRQYCQLIKNGTISFTSLLIEKYHLLNLNETDVIILIKLHQLLNEGTKKLVAKDIAPTMSISLNTISKRIVDLVNNGYITLSISKDNHQEEFSLDGVYKLLAAILEDGDGAIKMETNDNDIKKIVSLLEETTKKVISQVDLDIVRHWVMVDKITVSQVEEALTQCVKMKKVDVKYIDLILNKTKEEPKTKEQKEDLLALFSSIYDKK